MRELHVLAMLLLMAKEGNAWVLTSAPEPLPSQMHRLRKRHSREPRLSTLTAGGQEDNNEKATRRALERAFARASAAAVPESESVSASWEPFLHHIFLHARAERCEATRLEEWKRRVDWSTCITEFEQARADRFRHTFFEQSSHVFAEGVTGEHLRLPVISSAVYRRWIGNSVNERHYTAFLETPHHCCHPKVRCAPCDHHWGHQENGATIGGLVTKASTRVKSSFCRTVGQSANRLRLAWRGFLGKKPNLRPGGSRAMGQPS